MKGRLQNLIKAERLSASKFADRIGVQRSSISHILSGRNNPSMDFIQKVLKVFPHINSDWLLLGKGEMYNASLHPTIFEVSSQNDLQKKAESDNNLSENKQVTTDKPVNLSTSESNLSDINKVEDKILASQEDKVVIKKSEKEIDKIVVFYKDRTFIEYFPE